MYGHRFLFIGYVILLATCFTNIAYSHAQNQPPSKLTTVIWSPDGTKLASGDTNGALSIWNPVTGESLLKFQAHSGAIASLAWSPDNSRIASASSTDKSVRIWDISHARLITELQADIYNNDPVLVAWNSDGTKLVNVTSETDGGFPLHFWNVQGDQYEPMQVSQDMAAFNIAWRPNSTSLAVADYRGVYILQQFSFDYFKQHAILPFQFTIAWDHTGTKLATATGLDYINGTPQANREINVVNPDTGEILTTLQNIWSDPHYLGVDSIAWDVDNVKLFTDGFDGIVRIWDTSSGELLDTLSLGRKNGRFLMSLSPYGGRLALGNSASASDIATEQAASENVLQTLDDGAIQIVVPLPSLERLQSIASACNVPSQVLQGLPRSESHDQLASFINQIYALSSEILPSSCAADLVAVATVLQS